MANVLAELVVKIGADNTDVNAKLRDTFKQLKRNSEGYEKLSRFSFKWGAALTAFAGGVFLFLSKSASMAAEALGDNSFIEAQQNLQDAMDTLMTTIGMAVLPLLTDLISTIANVVSGFATANPLLFKFASIFLLIAGSIAAVLGPLGLFIGAIAPIIGLFAEGGLLAGISGLLLPLIALVGVFALAWITNFANIQQQTQIFIDGLMQIFKGLVKILSGDFSGLKDVLFGIWNSIVIGIGGFLFNLFNMINMFGVKLMFTLSDVMMQIAKVIIDGINKFVIKPFVDQINALISMANSVSRSLGGGNLFQKITAPQISTSGIDAAIAFNQQAQSNALGAMGNLTINFNDLTVNDDTKVDDIVKKVSDALMGQIKNQTVFGRGGA